MTAKTQQIKILRIRERRIEMKLKGLGKWIAAAGLFTAVAMTSVLPAFAANISQIRLTFKDNYNEPGVIEVPDVTCGTSGVEIESIEWSKDVEKWKPGTKVTATVTLSAASGEFYGTYNSKHVSISNGTFGKAAKEDENLKVTATYYPVVWLDSPEDAGWSISNRMKAVWKKVEYATGYQLRLYRDDSYLRTIDVTGVSKDLSEYMGKEGNYYYEIRAVGRTDNEAKYRKSSDYIVSSDHLLDDLGDTDGDWKNYAEGKKYVNENGETLTSQWQKIVGQWYYFDENGYMATGWKMVGNKWYYLGSDGKMVTGWKQIDGKWYFLDADGAMATGWRQTSPGVWYYLKQDGTMAVSTVVDGCTIDASGVYTSK